MGKCAMVWSSAAVAFWQVACGSSEGSSARLGAGDAGAGGDVSNVAALDAGGPSQQPAEASDASTSEPLPREPPSSLEELADYPTGAEIDPNPGAPGGKGQEVKLIVSEDAVLSIGNLGPFAYPGGEMQGTLTDLGGGKAEIFMPAATVKVAPLQIVSGINEMRVEIMPRDMRGLVDFCTGIVDMPFDARFQPIMLEMPLTPMDVITPLTTETSPGKNTPEQSLMGERLDRWGNLRLVGIADVPKNGDALVESVLGLPTDARTDMPGRMVFGEGPLLCPTETVATE